MTVADILCLTIALQKNTGCTAPILPFQAKIKARHAFKNSVISSINSNTSSSKQLIKLDSKSQLSSLGNIVFFNK